MEHLYSTQVIDRRPWADSLAILPGIGTAAHEYFHVWNVKRVRPVALGRTEVSARMASFHAPFWDGTAQQQPTNGSQTFFSYYTKGAGLALYLDLYVREKSNNRRALDDVFNTLERTVWNAPNASYYLQGRGYTELDVEQPGLLRLQRHFKSPLPERGRVGP